MIRPLSIRIHPHVRAYEIAHETVLVLNCFRSRLTHPVPENYTAPPFPSLSWPFDPKDSNAYLYYSSDIWRYTLYWTLIVYAAFHFGASGYAVVIQWRNWKTMWTIPVVYAVMGGIEATLAGSIVGVMCYSTYKSKPRLKLTILLALEQSIIRGTFECRHGYHLFGLS